MTMDDKPDNDAPDGRHGATAKGRARFEVDGKALAVHVDRQGFRRLLQTLEQLAATGESQTFEKSGRGPRRKNGEGPDLLRKIIFHIDDRR